MTDPQRCYLGVFFREWELYRRKGAEERVECGDSAIMEVPFDSDVKPGEVRVFADDRRLLTGLVLVSQEESGWLVVPVSEFTVPATEQEILIGERVYQLWNAFTASADYVSRSWTVEAVPSEDVGHVAAAMANVLAGDALPGDLTSLVGCPIVRTDDPRLDYEREFAWRPEMRVVEPVAVSGFFTWRRSLMGMAACFVILCGVVTLLLREPPRPEPCSFEPSTTIATADHSHVAEPVVEPIAETIAVSDLPSVPEPLIISGPVDEPPPAPGRPAVPEPPTASEPVVEPPRVHERMDVARVRAGALRELTTDAEDFVAAQSINSDKHRRTEVRAAKNTDSCAFALSCAVDDDFEVYDSRKSSAPEAMSVLDESGYATRSLRYPASVAGGFRRTADTPLSTVALVDADNAGYLTIRSYLKRRRSRLPPYETVRLEELVNYFRFSYPEPTNDAPVAVDCELAACPWNRAHQLLRIGVQAKKRTRSQFGYTAGVLANDVKLQLEFNPGRVSAYCLMGYDGLAASGGSGGGDTRTICSGYATTVFFELVPAEAANAADRPELLTVRLGYRKPDSGTVSRLDFPKTAAEITRAEGPSEDFRFASAVAEFALLLGGSTHRGEASYASLIRRAKSAKGADGDLRRADFIRLAEIAASLSPSADSDEDSDF